jgi:hypothetical protein
VRGCGDFIRVNKCKAKVVKLDGLTDATKIKASRSASTAAAKEKEKLT